MLQGSAGPQGKDAGGHLVCICELSGAAVLGRQMGEKWLGANGQQ